MTGKIPPLERKRQEQTEAVQSAASRGDQKRAVEKATQAAAAGLGAGAPVTGGSLGQQALMHVGKAGIQSELEQIKRMSFGDAVRGMQRGPQMAALRAGSKGLQENIPEQQTQYQNACRKRALELYTAAAVAVGVEPALDPTGDSAIALLDRLESLDEKGYNTLHRAVRAGDAARVQALIDVGVDLNMEATPRTPLTPLITPAMMALELPQGADVAMLAQLLRGGANVNWVDRKGDSLLNWAARFDETGAICQQLLAAGASLESRNHLGLTPLMQAVYVGCSEKVVPVLLAHGARTEVMDTEGRTVLHHAAATGSDRVVELLLQAKADVSVRNLAGQTPFHVAHQRYQRTDTPMIDRLTSAALAARQQQTAATDLDRINAMSFVRVIRELLTMRGSQPAAGAKETNRREQLMRAYEQRALDLYAVAAAAAGLKIETQPTLQKVVEVLNQLERLDADGFNAVHRAVIAADGDRLKTLIYLGMDLNAKASTADLNSTPLGIATTLPEERRKLLVKQLLEAGADVNWADDRGTTLLMAAVHVDKTGNLCKTLVAAGANLEARSQSGETALMHAASFVDRGNAILILLGLGAKTDTADLDGNTALHHAAKRGNLLAVQLLLDGKANAQIGNKAGETPQDLAKKAGFNAVVELLEKSRP
jgi:ankyrin repeat protein